MAWLAQYGVDVVAVEWTGEEDLIANFEEPLLPAIATHSRKFVILYDLFIRFDGIGLDFGRSNVREQFVADMDTFASNPTYFQHPNYLKLNNKPVIYIYISRAISSATQEPGQCQGSACIEQAFNQARQAAQGAGFDDLYIVADHLWWVPDYSNLVPMGAQAATAFGPVVHADHPYCPDCPDVSQNQEDRPVKQWADLMAQQLYEGARPQLSVGGNLVDVTPGVFVQFDNSGAATGYDLQTYHLKDVSDWSYMSKTAGWDQARVAVEATRDEDCIITRRTNTDYTSIVWVYSFNEWGEGTGLEPLDPPAPPYTYPYRFGFEPLQALQAVIQGSSLPPVDPPARPIPRAPKGAVQSLRPTFGWDGVYSADSYQLKVWNGSQLVISATVGDDTGDGIPETTYSPTSDLTAGATHTWKVRAHNSVGWGDYSSLKSFTTPPSSPVLPQCGAPTPDPLQFYDRSMSRSDFPCRILDTRITGPRLQHNSTYSFQMSGSCGIPGTANAISAVLTAVNPTAAGDLRTSPGCVNGSGRVSDLATLNLDIGRFARNNNAILPLSSTGTIAVQALPANGGSVDLVIDVTGFFAPGDGSGVGNDYTPMYPSRLVDTRNPAGPLGGPPLGGGVTRGFTAQGNMGIPSTGVRALAGNATVVGPAASGHLRLFKGTDNLPSSYSSLNYQEGETVANGSIIPIGSGVIAYVGSQPITGPDLNAWSLQNTHLVYDVTGFFHVGPADQFRIAAPCRLVDTRVPPHSGVPFGGPALTAGTARMYSVAGQCGIPASARALALNVTVTQPTGAGHLRLYPLAGNPPPPPPAVSAINYSAGQTLANGAIVALGSYPLGSTFAIYCGQATGTTHVIIDVTGYFE